MATFQEEFVHHVSSAEQVTDYDAIVVVGPNPDGQLYPEFISSHLGGVRDLQQHDASDDLFVLVGNDVLVIWSSTGPLNRDHDDVRMFKDASVKGVKRALKAGKRAPLLAVANTQNNGTEYQDGLLVSLLAALEAVYVPIEVREAFPDKQPKVSAIGIASTELDSEEKGAQLITNAMGLEYGRIIARDIGGSDPERMAPPKVEDYLRSTFNGTSVKMNVIAGHTSFTKDYPLFAAVDRCADVVHRHQGRIVYLEYTSADEVKQTHMFVGKGVTYDTGGADVKAGGVMAGMHRDKCGAAAIAGLFGTLDKLKPSGVKVIGRLAMVRNSIGANSYVADEIITSAAGVRVRVGNTDAEGRMAMSDPLYHTKQQALSQINPHIYTIATLTGHAVLAMGEAYSIAMDNGPARCEQHAQHLQKIGHLLSDPFEISTIRREDYNFVAGRNEYEDVIQCNNQPSSRTPRGHQFPAAFMIRASGLDGHGVDSDQPLKYTHIDIAGSSGHYPGIPTAAPLLSIVKLTNAF